VEVPDFVQKHARFLLFLGSIVFFPFLSARARILVKSGVGSIGEKRTFPSAGIIAAENDRSFREKTVLPSPFS